MFEWCLISYFEIAKLAQDRSLSRIIEGISLYLFSYLFTYLFAPQKFLYYVCTLLFAAILSWTSRKRLQAQLRLETPNTTEF